MELSANRYGRDMLFDAVDILENPNANKNDRDEAWDNICRHLHLWDNND